MPSSVSPEFSLNDANILVTGGTGSFGQQFVQHLLEHHRPRRLVVFSRDELKQFEMGHRFPEAEHPCLRYFIGDVRDGGRLNRALAGVDVVVHAAAMKQITAAEYNPTECIATNVLGAQNVIDAAINNGVSQVVALSTDKAANPINLYGATKLCSDKLFVSANNLSGRTQTRFSIVRYGNVIGSRGSVIPYFKKLIARGQTELPVTHPEMTRFAITLEQGVRFVVDAIQNMAGGEIFVPKLPSMRILDLVAAFGDGVSHKMVGIRAGEKLHELMISREDSMSTVDMGDHFIIQPALHWWNTDKLDESTARHGTPCPAAFEYSSDSNSDWIDVEGLKQIVAAVDAT